MKNLCIFLNSGKTFSFKNIKELHDNETVYDFSYTAMSDNLQKKAVFYKNHVAGISVYDTDPQVDPRGGQVDPRGGKRYGEGV